MVANPGETRSQMSIQLLDLSPQRQYIRNTPSMASLVTFVFLILSPSVASLALGSTPAITPSPVHIHPLTNLTSFSYIPQYYCDSSVANPIDPVDCSVAVSHMLTTRGSYFIRTFGAGGDYSGLLSWTFRSCAVTLDVRNVHMVYAQLTFFAAAAAQVTKYCLAWGYPNYYGGNCVWAEGEYRGIAVMVGKTIPPSQQRPMYRGDGK